MATDDMRRQAETSGAIPRRRFDDLNYAYSRVDAAARLSIHPDTLDVLIKQGRIRVVKLGKVVRVPARELERLLTIL